MAKQIGIIRFSGKLGETVGRKANYKGTETIGKRATSVRNPKSTLQCVQRMILATASGLLSAFSNVLNNSVEGTQKGAASLAYWRKEWMNMLRTSNILTAPNGFIYAKKGDNYPVPNQLPVSKGMLEGLPIDSVNGNDLAIYGTKIAVDGEKNPTAAFAACNYTLGDQITIMLLSGIDDVAYPSVLRFAFNDDTKPAFVLVDGSTYKLNTEALDLTKCEGRFQDVKFAAAQNGTINVLDCVNYDFLFAAAIIVSRKEGQKRSTSSFVVAQDVELPGYSAVDAVGSYSGAATNVEAASDIYLDNSTTIVTPVQPEPEPEPEPYPRSITINGASNLTDTTAYTFVKEMVGEYTESIRNVVWSLTPNAASSITSQNQNQAVITVTSVDSAVNATLTCQVTFSDGHVMSATKAITITPKTWPSTSNIAGDSEITADGDYNFTVGYQPNDFTAQITEQQWSVSGSTHATVAIQAGAQCSLRVSGITASAETITLTCVTTLEGGRSVTATKQITLQYQEPQGAHISSLVIGGQNVAKGTNKEVAITPVNISVQIADYDSSKTYGLGWEEEGSYEVKVPINNGTGEGSVNVPRTNTQVMLLENGSPIENYCFLLYNEGD